MGSDGFGTLTAGIMKRGTDRVQSVLSSGGSLSAMPQRNEVPHASVQPQLNGTADSKMQSQGSVQATMPRQLTPSARRATSGTTLKIHQPAPDMSEVTVSMWGAKPEDTEADKPSKDGQRPTSVTYERCTLSEHEEREAQDTPAQTLWIDTPSFSGPDRREDAISPEVERRKSVPARLKVGVRLEQERYLRLKLATQQSGRTQQDLITAALDNYLDQIGVDRFVRVAMGFGGVAPSGNKVETKGSVKTSNDA